MVVFKMFEQYNQEINSEPDRRRYKRVHIDSAGAEYHLVDFTRWAEYRSRGRKLLKDISMGGISFNSQDILPHDSLVAIELKVGDLIKVGDVCGRIVRARKLENGGYEIGVSFSWWGNEADKKALATLVLPG